MKEKIHNFHFKGINIKGKKISGEVSEVSEAAAREFLANQNITVKRIKKKTNLAFLNGRIKPLDTAIFFRQLAVMLKTGIPLIKALQLINRSISKLAMKDVVSTVISGVEGGDSFSTSLRKHPMVFDNLTCALVAAGENSGKLDSMLEQIAIYKEKSEVLRQKVKKALKYPIAVLVVALIVTAILMIKVIPVFQELFESFGGELPAYTQMVISLSELFQEYILFMIAACILLWLGFKHLYARSEKFRNMMAEASLKMPIFGDLFYKSIIARYSRTLATTFAAGVPLSEALTNAGQATANIVYEDAVEEIRDDVINGQSLFFAMKNSTRFPDMAVQMTSMGEESGELDTMLDKVATYYESEVDTSVEGIAAMLEPLIMAILGVLVGGLVVAMYLPIFQMGAVV